MAHTASTPDSTSSEGPGSGGGPVPDPRRTRKRAALFSGFLSHYLIRDRYGRPGKGNDKGNVEGLVGYCRRNFLVPMPEFASWEEFNLWLEEQCRKRQQDKVRGQSETIGERLQRDLAAMQPLPATPFEACDQAGGRVSSQSLVRYKTNDYSVPVAWGHQEVWIRAYVDEVVIGCRSEVIARHPRCYAREEVIFDPLHYLPLIEQKITPALASSSLKVVPTDTLSNTASTATRRASAGAFSAPSTPARIICSFSGMPSFS